MAAANTDKLKKYKSLFSTTLSTGIGTGTGDTITPASVSGLPTDTAITLTFDRVDSGGVATPTKLERIVGVISGGNFTSYVRGVDGTTEQAHTAGAVIEMIWNADDWNDAVDWALTQHNQDGTHGAITSTNASMVTASMVTPTINAGKFITSINDANGNEVIKTPATTSAVNEITVTNAATGNAPEISVTGADDNIDLYLKGKGSGRVKAYDGSSYVEIGASIISTTKYAPQGFLLNGKIVPSVTSNNLTVALKGMDGNDPSASNPIYVRIGDTVRTITSALSVTTNAGTNWCNAGATELATKEIDYFVYLGYNTTDGVVIGFGRIPSANEYGDFSTTSTNEKYCAISTITNAVSGDDYELVGRFAATLSAGAGYTWSVPTFTNKNLIQKPIYETRWLNYVPTFTGSGGSVGSFATDRTLGKYKIRDSAISLSTHSRITNVGSWSGDLRMAIPFKPNYESTTMIMLGTLVANNANPLAASKGLANLNDGSSLIYFTANIWNSYTQWSSVAANDSVLLSATYAI